MPKIKFEIEFAVKTSPKLLFPRLSTASGLSEWFADDVNIKDDIYTFLWDGSEEQARLITKKANSKVRWQWLEDEEEGLDTYFELRYEIDPMTKSVILTLTSFAEPDEVEESRFLWEGQIGQLKRKLGA